MLYANTIKHNYAWDDQLVITQNAVTQKGVSGLKEIWTGKTFIPQRPIYRPIPQSIFALEWELFNTNSLPYHLVQVLLYGFLAISFLYALNLFFENIPRYLLGFIALLFALLPVHAEVVANIKSADELLSAIFVVWALIFTRSSRISSKMIGVVFFGLALLSKVSAITLTPLLLLPFLYNNSYAVKLLTLLKAQADRLLLVVTFTFALFLHFSYPDLAFLSLFLIVLLILFIDISVKKPLHLLLAGLSILFLKFGLGIELALVISVFWYYQLSDKSFSLKNKELIFVLLAISISALSAALGANLIFIPVFLTLWTIYHLEKNDASKLKIFGLQILILVILGILSILNKSANFTVLFLFTSPFLFHFIKTYTPKHFKIIIFSLLLLSSLLDHPDEFLNLPDLTQFVEKDTTKIKQAGIFYNEPFHNILVIAERKSQKSATICRIQLVYLQKLIFPTTLVHQHGTWQIELASWKDWDVYLSILIHILLLWLAFYFYKQKYYLTMWGILWYFSTISIYTNIVRLMPDTLAERFLFLPSIGFSIAFVSGLYFFIQKFQKEEKKSLITLALILAPLFSYYAYKTVDRNKDWKDNYTLAANTLPYAENNAAINAQYALELNNLVKAGKIQNVDSAEALVVKHYNRAIEIFPDFYGPQADLANYYIINSKPELAFPFLKEAVRLKPEEWIHHYFLGLIYYERKEYADGVNQFTAMIQDAILQENPARFPELLEAYEFKARCLHNIGNDEEAYKTLEAGIAVFKERSTYILLANLYRVTGKVPLAIATFERLLVIFPEDQELINTIELLKQGKIL